MTICVGMSGGVDSSLTAALLKEAGYKVFGLFMKNWEETLPDGRCTATREFEDVAAVCEMLDIPYYSVNFTKEYRERVFEEFLHKLRLGKTPNPDILCNSEIKFDVFLQKAKMLGADALATGHYVQARDGKLFKGADHNKDQSYFLHAVTQSALKQALFPLGGYTKSEVREAAKKRALPTAQKKDSTGICFIGKRPFAEFVSGYLPYTPGDIVSAEGKKLGTHQGVAFYTIGQRRGLGLGGPGDPYFVCHKDTEANILYVAQGENHPALYSQELIAHPPHWIDEPPSLPFRCCAKVRYRQNDQPCTVLQDGAMLRVVFDTPQRAVTPAQAIVFYNKEQCLGGAEIDRAL